ncbi:MAG: chloride channel protein, partial [Rhodospirillales bacterium]|nr:chloride channel protein [Rhodospirillales bacterium]
YALSAFAPIVIASVVGTMTTQAYFGDFPAFEIVTHSTAQLIEIPAFAGLGVLAAIAALALMHGTELVAKTSERLPGPRWLRPGLAGLAVGGIALAVPQVIGLGYGATVDALSGYLPITVLIAAFVGKLVATCICLGGGFGGGVFSPSLVIGAMLGGAYGIVISQMIPAFSQADAYTIVGMGAVAAAVLGAPISTTLIIFEMTGDYSLTMAVMVAVVISSMIAKQVSGHSFFTFRLAQRGLDLGHGFEAAILHRVRIGDLMATDCASLGADVRLPEIRRRLQSSGDGELFVTGKDGELIGTITLADLSDVAFDNSADDLICASDVARRHPPVILVTDDLERALEVFRSFGEQHIAVVEDAESFRFIGCVHERDVMAAYNRALLESHREERE